MAVTVRALRELAGRHIRPIRAAFAHARNADLPEFARSFGCPVEFGRTVDEGVASHLLEFSTDAVAAPLLTANPKLLKALEPFCDMAAKERRTASDMLRAAVEKEAEKLQGAKANRRKSASRGSKRKSRMPRPPGAGRPRTLHSESRA
jgi:hypothetical protein